jgi:hypothetical protein
MDGPWYKIAVVFLLTKRFLLSIPAFLLVWLQMIVQVCISYTVSQAYIYRLNYTTTADIVATDEPGGNCNLIINIQMPSIMPSQNKFYFLKNIFLGIEIYSKITVQIINCALSNMYIRLL